MFGKKEADQKLHSDLVAVPAMSKAEYQRMRAVQLSVAFFSNRACPNRQEMLDLAKEVYYFLDVNSENRNSDGVVTTNSNKKPPQKKRPPLP